MQAKEARRKEGPVATPHAGPVGTRVTATLTPRGKKMVSNGIPPGNTVSVTRAELRVLAAEKQVTVVPLVTSVNPTTGPNGQMIDIYGSGFLPQGANSQVTVGGVVATVVAWFNDAISAMTVQGANPLATPVPVVVRNQAMNTINAGNFTFTAAGMAGTEGGNPSTVNPLNVTPTDGVNGDTITITGTGFEARGANSQVTVGGIVQGIVAWSDTSITAQAAMGTTPVGVPEPVVVRAQSMLVGTAPQKFTFGVNGAGAVQR